ncbi:guanine nucleotide-binding protein alpha-3 subunit [Armillaria novae-zelandiae]|uniref:Guanine nucleotide-binding protein alpha-3 subunit n=1 Tax=Armillaria novae-zelandiae TaxID=153914 RepID=A0AA39NV02_9AGAR|nr:guanine nucleotide-binding protein alpha-3 subunit [Armillaria novae-zelandiae]
MVDIGGQCSQHCKWIHCLQSMTSIIFCTAISEHDQVLLEDREQNHLAESLKLFESVITSWWLLQTSIVLFLTKINVFKKKIPDIPLEHYFPTTKYILCQFMQANRAILVQATITSMSRLVFPTVKETMLQHTLKESEKMIVVIVLS